MIIGKKEQERLEREQCAQISLLCRQKLMGYAESFEELGKSFRREIQITGEDRQNILEKCMLWQSRQIMGDHLQEVARIMERVAGEELGYCPLEEKKRKSLVQALKSEGIIARDLCYVEKDGSSSGTEAGISMTLSTEKRHYKAAQVADMLTVLLGKKAAGFFRKPLSRGAGAALFSVHRGTEIHSTDGGEPGGKRRGESLGGSVCHHGIGKREADPAVV